MIDESQSQPCADGSQQPVLTETPLSDEARTGPFGTNSLEESIKRQLEALTETQSLGGEP